MSAVTPAARRALKLIDSGYRMDVTRRMLDRLWSDGLIDLGLLGSPNPWWYVTDKGREVMG